MACDCIRLRIISGDTLSGAGTQFIESYYDLTETNKTGTFGNGQPYWQFEITEFLGTTFEVSQSGGTGQWYIWTTNNGAAPNEGTPIFEEQNTLEEKPCPNFINWEGPPTWDNYIFSPEGFQVLGSEFSAARTECCAETCTNFYFYFDNGAGIGYSLLETPTGQINGTDYWQFEPLVIDTNLPSGSYLQLSRGTDGLSNWSIYVINNIGDDPTTQTELWGEYIGDGGGYPECPNQLLSTTSFWTFYSGGSLPPDLDFVTTIAVDCPTTTTTTTTTTATTTTTTTTIKPQPPINVEPRNECDVITIFPMGATCNVVNPTDTETFDGIASLEITGGTPPYTISWDNKNYSNTITNIGVGEYNATITDFYNDFTIVTTCVLTATTPTSTTTTSTTTLPSFGDLCASIDPADPDLPTDFYNFEYNGYINGKPSWETSDGQFVMYWNTGTTDLWVVSAITSNNTIAVNYNAGVPPLNGWQLLGTKDTVSVVEGSCDETPIQPLRLSISIDDPDCEKAQNGSITVQAFGGIQPYYYSKDGGVIYQTNPIFNNLAAGIYNISVKDSATPPVIVSDNVTLTNQTPTLTTYVVTLNTDYTNNTFSVNVSPAIPQGVSITFNIIYKSTFYVTPSPTAASYDGDLDVFVDGSGPIVETSEDIILQQSPNTRCGGLIGEGDIITYSYNTYTTLTKRVWQNITMTNGTTVNGTIIDQITDNDPLLKCFERDAIPSITLDDVSISGCDPCCTVRFIRPVGPKEPGATDTGGLIGIVRG